MRQTILTLISLGTLLAAAVAVAVWGWREIGDVAISAHGLVALGLGIAVTAAVGVGLMTLLFFSHRRGFDEQVYDWERDRRRRRRSPPNE